MTIRKKCPENELKRTVTTLSSVESLRENIEKKPDPTDAEKYFYDTEYCEISFRIENIWTKNTRKVKKMTVSHLWIDSMIRGNGYGSIIRNTLEKIAHETHHVETLTFEIQVDSGYEDEIFESWGYRVYGPYKSDYENKMITAEKDIE